ncbi:hypothetical protein EVB64_117 [Rhizobium phage RHph_TM61]|nr:hypothetical protein EVB64_117 [Rhizobium phage RHph_TM61]
MNKISEVVRDVEFTFYCTGGFRTKDMTIFAKIDQHFFNEICARQYANFPKQLPLKGKETADGVLIGWLDYKKNRYHAETTIGHAMYYNRLRDTV